MNKNCTITLTKNDDESVTMSLDNNDLDNRDIAFAGFQIFRELLKDAFDIDCVVTSKASGASFNMNEVVDE